MDLRSAPPSNAYLSPAALAAAEQWFPLRVLICERCWLAQTEDSARAEQLFDAEYAYFSGYSKSWLEHAQRYVIDVIGRFDLKPSSYVVEVAANDGYLLQYVQARGIPCIGVEPTASTAGAARAKGISIVEDFFGVRLATQMLAHGRRADLVVANNVLAHVPDINDFVAGFAVLLSPAGAVTFEFPHLLRMMSDVQFDTIYHEHFSYLSLLSVERILAANGLMVFDVEEHPTHGGSLRVFAQLASSGKHRRTAAVDRLLEREVAAGMATSEYYAGFQSRADRIKDDFLAFLLNAKSAGQSVAAYGAAAKGNTLLNYAGVKSDLISFVVDASPAKQGKYLPGSRIPIVNEQRIRDGKPAFVIILPWNLKDEVMRQIEYIRDWGGRFVTAIPRLEVA